MVQGSRWAVLVKQVWSELNSRLGHGESIKPSPPRAEGEEGCGTLRECNPEEIFTAGNLHTGKKVSWLLRGGNCMLLGPDLLSAVLGWDCHTHTQGCYGIQSQASSEHCSDAEKATRPRCAANAETWKNVEDGLVSRPTSLVMQPIRRKLRFPSFTGKPLAPAQWWSGERKTPYNNR